MGPVVNIPERGTWILPSKTPWRAEPRYHTMQQCRRQWRLWREVDKEMRWKQNIKWVQGASDGESKLVARNQKGSLTQCEEDSSTVKLPTNSLCNQFRNEPHRHTPKFKKRCISWELTCAVIQQGDEISGPNSWERVIIDKMSELVHKTESDA
jgi:hypothetical protein